MMVSDRRVGHGQAATEPRPTGSRAAAAMLALACAGCFDTSATLHLPCERGEQCGRDQSCVLGFCDGPPAEFDPTAYCGDGIASEGELCWEESTRYATAAQPAAVIVVDLDGDGALDVVVANENAGSVSVLRGTGDGTLDPAETFTVGNLPVSVAAGDLDEDGWLDIAVATRDAVALLMSSAGSYEVSAFVPAMEITNPVAVDMGDIDGDGAIDLVVAGGSGMGRGVTMAINDGSGALVADAPVETMGAPQPDSVRIGRIAEPDGAMHAFVGTDHGIEHGTVDDWKGHMLAGRGVSPALGQLNGQVGSDVVVAVPDAGTIVILSGMPTGETISTTAPIEVGQAPIAIALGDLDLNGTLDLVVADPFTANDRLWLIATDPTNMFEPATRPPVSLAVAGTPQDVALGDLDGDGRLDLVTADRGAGGVSVHLSGH